MKLSNAYKRSVPREECCFKIMVIKTFQAVYALRCALGEKKLSNTFNNKLLTLFFNILSIMHISVIP